MVVVFAAPKGINHKCVTILYGKYKLRMNTEEVRFQEPEKPGDIAIPKNVAVYEL